MKYILFRNSITFQCNSQEKFEDTKEINRSRMWKDRQCNDQQKKDKRTNNDLYNTTWKTKD